MSSAKDVMTHILGKIAQNAERKAIRTKIYALITLSQCFQEITHREEVARTGFAAGRNMRQYDGGRKIEKKAKTIMLKWDDERVIDAQIQRNLARRAEEQIYRRAEEPPRKPGPNTKCDGCQKVPDSRLRQCGRCKHAVYCTTECQRRAWRRHREECRIDGLTRAKFM
jgi:hypothetical protein